MKRDRKLRNIGIIAHVDAGKTTTTERMLYYTNTIHKPGNIDDGNTVTDSDPQEAKRGITISSSAISAEWNYNETTHQINIIDTPGHIDFAIEVERSLRVLDGVVALFCASSGVEPQSETVWSQSNKHGIPKLCFINKMDRIGANFFKVVHDIEHELNAKPLVLQIPIGEGDNFIGIIDLLKEKALYWNTANLGHTWEEKTIPEDLKPLTLKWKERLIETLSGFDEPLLIKYLEDKPISSVECINSIRRATIKQQIVPVLCGSSFKYIGVQPLLNAISQYLPAPEDIKYIKGINKNNEEELRLRSVNTPFTGLIFKVVSDKYVGNLAMVRVYTGTIKAGDTILNATSQQKNRVSRILKIQANKFSELKEAKVGDIVALIGLKNVKTGHTLCKLGDTFILESIDVSEPVISIAVEPKSKDDEKNFGEAIAKILDEDPSLRISLDQQTGQTILHGMGELHLDVRLEKLRAEFGVAIQKGKPKVSFKERLQVTVEHTETFRKQTGGSGQFAQITFTLGPSIEKQKGLEFVNEVKGGNIPKDFIPNVEKGFLEAMQSGVLAGYPVETMRVVLLDGKIHTEDSNALDFEIVAKNAFKKVATLTKPMLLEPIMNAEIECPEAYLGKVTSDINRKRGVIMNIREDGTKRKIRAQLPLLETFGYISDLRTLTSGRGTISLTLLKYSKVNNTVLNQIVV